MKETLLRTIGKRTMYALAENPNVVPRAATEPQD